MGIEFSIACFDCRTFVYTYKWAIIEDAVRHRFDATTYDRDLFQEQLSYCVINVDAETVINAVDNESSEFDYIQSLIPTVRTFAIEHQPHRMFISGDIGDEPWAFPEPCWWRWKAIGGHRNRYGYLPRNLIETCAVCDWASALGFLRSNYSEWAPSEPLSEEGLQFKLGFDSALAEFDGQH